MRKLTVSPVHVPTRMVAALRGSFEALHSEGDRRCPGREIALICLSADETTVERVVLLGVIARAQVDDRRLRIELASSKARESHGAVFHERGNRSARTENGLPCVMHVADRRDIEAMVGVLRYYTTNVLDLR